MFPLDPPSHVFAAVCSDGIARRAIASSLDKVLTPSHKLPPAVAETSWLARVLLPAGGQLPRVLRDLSTGNDQYL